MTSAAIMLIAMLFDAAFGWPQRLFRVIGHPVTWIGHLITRLDLWFNLDGGGESARRFSGVITAFLVIGAVTAVGATLQQMLPGGSFGLVVSALIAWPFLAARSLREHVEAVADPLLDGNLPQARRAVSMIVGRDPDQLDREGVSRATLESLAENTSDGVLAPIFWGVIFGLPGVFAYKAINTLDSMIGHRNDRYAAFGWASARIDDLANLIPARLTGLLFAAVSTRPRVAVATMWRDARKHRSPNAGWPEAALAGALEVRLSGPRVYGDRIADEPWLNERAPDPRPEDVERGLRLYRYAMLALGLVLFAGAVF